MYEDKTMETLSVNNIQEAKTLRQKELCKEYSDPPLPPI